MQTESSTPTERNWTTVGAAYTGPDDRPRVKAAIAALTWQDFTEGMSLPAIPGLNITATIRELRLPKVSALAWNGSLDYPEPESNGTVHAALYGIEAHYNNGRARVYALDLGSRLLPLASDFWPNGPESDDAGAQLALNADDGTAASETPDDNRPHALTYRERRERRAERLRGWADSREAKADAAREGVDRIAGMIPMGQPVLVGHHSERRHRRDLDRIDNGMRQTVENGRKADEYRDRADNIERQARQAIYDDDPDARERLAEKIARLETQRDRMKERNAAHRKAHRAELKGMTAYQRDQAAPHPGWEVRNLSANISRLRKRLESLAAPKQEQGRWMDARFASDCGGCGGRIEKGTRILYVRRDRAAYCEPCAVSRESAGLGAEDLPTGAVGGEGGGS